MTGNRCCGVGLGQRAGRVGRGKHALAIQQHVEKNDRERLGRGRLIHHRVGDDARTPGIDHGAGVHGLVVVHGMRERHEDRFETGGAEFGHRGAAPARQTTTSAQA